MAVLPTFLKSRFAALDNIRFPGHLKHLSPLSACFLLIWTPTPQNTATNPSERISLGSTPLPKPKSSMSLKSCSKRSPRSTKRKPLWFELIQGCRNSRPPFQNHSPESGYRFVITKGRHDSLPPSLHRPKLDNKTLLSFTHTKSTLPPCKVLSFSFFVQPFTAKTRNASISSKL